MAKPRKAKTPAAAAKGRKKLPSAETRIVYTKSGGVCAFPDCGKELVQAATKDDDPAFVGEIAHIVADSRQGPRGDVPLSAEDRERHPNLILLCRDHHKVIDSQPRTYSVTVLRQMKADHEVRLREALSQPAPASEVELRAETIHSSLLPVTHLPAGVFSAPCAFTPEQEDEVKARIRYPADREELVRFLLRDGRLYSFHDLREEGGPFASVTDRRGVELHRAATLWDDAEGQRRYVSLLNKALFRYTARLGMRYDPEHYRFYFEQESPGQPREVSYRPLNAGTATRLVVWEPKRKATGEGRGFWWHFAVGLRFHRVAERQWCLSLRPERHLTSDGVTPLASDQIGRRVTRVKARMYNEGYLTELNFWRDYLSGGTPRIILNFGRQSALIETRFLSFDVDWPGIPGDDKPFKNQDYEDDLFTLGDFRLATGGDFLDWEDTDDSHWNGDEAVTTGA